MDLSLAEFVLLLLGFAGSVVIAGTVISRWCDVRHARRAAAKLVICRLCLRSFENLDRAQVLACPDCGAGNQK